MTARSLILVIAAIIMGGTEAPAGHGDPPPPPPPGHGKVLVRLVWPRGERTAIPNGQVPLQGVELHRGGAAEREGWTQLPPIRPEFSAQELNGGQVWVADMAVKAGEFDRVRMGGTPESGIPFALRVTDGQWIIVTLEVGFQPGRAGAPLRLELKRARIMGPS